MVKYYDLKLNPVVKEIVDLYIDVDPRKRFDATSTLLKDCIHVKLDEILDFFENELKNDNNFQRLINSKYKKVKEILEKNLRYSI